MKAVGNGTAKVVAIAEDNTKNAFKRCEVTATMLVSDFWFDYDEHTMHHYQYMQMGYTWTPWNAKNPSLSWKSSNKDIATVDQNGTVYSNNGIWNGSTWITGTTVDGSNITRSFLVHVKEAFVEGISLSDSSINLKVGQGHGFGWSTWPDYAANHSVSWSSSNESVATVSGGWVAAKGAGTCTIIATTYLGHSASCTVTVTGGTSSGTPSVGGDNDEYTGVRSDYIPREGEPGFVGPLQAVPLEILKNASSYKLKNQINDYNTSYTQSRTNCFAFAMDVTSSSKMPWLFGTREEHRDKTGKIFALQPGFSKVGDAYDYYENVEGKLNNIFKNGRANNYSELVEYVTADAKKLGKTLKRFDYMRDKGGYIVTLMVDTSVPDYHWYRLNKLDWEDKPGSTAAQKISLQKGQYPQDYAASTGYTEFVGYFYVK